MNREVPVVAGVATIVEGRWGLSRARAVAAEGLRSPAAAAALVRLLFAQDPEARKRSADVLRRMTEGPARQAEELPGARGLRKHAAELIGRLATLPPEEARTRWHLGLVVARIAHTGEQRLRAARLMEALAGDGSVVVRCSGIEGLGLLACAEPSLRPLAEEIIAHAHVAGTAGERCRARDARRRLEASEHRSGVGRAGAVPSLRRR